MDYIVYLAIFILLFILEQCYFRIADRCNIIDKPNERSSHTKVVLRGGGVIFAISILVWMALQMVHGEWFMVKDYMPFIVGLVLICGVSFIDDIHSLPDSVRLVAQFAAMLLLFQGIGIMHWNMWWFVILSLFVCVGATNIYNFMDGINGITAGYSLAVLIPLLAVQVQGSRLASPTIDATRQSSSELGSALTAPIIQGFIEPSLLVTVGLSLLVFCFFNFRPKGKAKCFAGDVGSIGMAFILLFCIGRLVMRTWDVTWLIFLVVYGMDGCLTIIHRIMLHERLGEAHRKHAYQLMANELGMSHVTVSTLYMLLQLAISLIMIYIIPNTALAHWCYMIGVMLLLTLAYVLFMKKYYHLHEEYLASIKKSEVCE